MDHSKYIYRTKRKNPKVHKELNVHAQLSSDVKGITFCLAHHLLICIFCVHASNEVSGEIVYLQMLVLFYYREWQIQ